MKGIVGKTAAVAVSTMGGIAGAEVTWNAERTPDNGIEGGRR